MTVEGDRYVVGRWARWHAVFDEAETRGRPVSTHADQIDAIAEAARRNAAARRAT